ncbi:prokineticin receptor 1a [Corythoichthys intestinalis]|uniref:prokineticin receptor 1a n=1 Tax=Corythoichthys intestinalis TaxID=161448 RepID=UPI0025A4E020|nr:prokineticin receptor 1a [Corythoichthys intestinalis]
MNNSSQYLLSDSADYNSVDYEVSPEEIPDATRGPAFLVASVVIAMSLVTIMAVCGAGNCAFIISLLRDGRRRGLTDLLMANLAVSDTLVAAICCPLLLDYYVISRLSWRHGLVACAVVNYLRTLSLHVSTNALLAIAVDRYAAIVHPLGPGLPSHMWYIVLIAVWGVPAVISIPSATMSSETEYPHGQSGPPKTFCAQIWPVDQRVLYRSYFLLVLALEFLVPVLVMAVCYARISKELWFKKVPGFQTLQIRKRLRKRRRTVLVLMLVLLAYILCWTPYYGFSLLRDFYPTVISRDRNALVVFYIMECVAMSNGVINTLCFVSVRHKARKNAKSKQCIPAPLVLFVSNKSICDEARTSSLRVTEELEGGSHRS